MQGIAKGLHKHPLHVILVAPNQEEFDKVFQLAKAEKNWKEQTHLLTLWGNSKSIFMLLSLSLSLSVCRSLEIYILVSVTGTLIHISIFCYNSRPIYSYNLGIKYTIINYFLQMYTGMVKIKKVLVLNLISQGSFLS